MSFEKRNVVEARRTPKKERQEADWAKQAAAEFKPETPKTVKPSKERR